MSDVKTIFRRDDKISALADANSAAAEAAGYVRVSRSPTMEMFLYKDIVEDINRAYQTKFGTEIEIFRVAETLVSHEPIFHTAENKVEYKPCLVDDWWSLAWKVALCKHENEWRRNAPALSHSEANEEHATVREVMRAGLTGNMDVVASYIAMRQMQKDNEHQRRMDSSFEGLSSLSPTSPFHTFDELRELNGLERMYKNDFTELLNGDLYA